MYRIRPGIVLTNVCDEHFLVSGKSARELCPYVTNLNDTAVYIYEKLSEGCTEEEILRCIQEEYEIEDADQIKGVIDAFVSQLLENGYMMEVENSDE